MQEACELFQLIPREKLNYLFTHSDASVELDFTFLGFEEVYKDVLGRVPKNKVILDLGCAYATQSWYFRDFAGYIGVDAWMNDDSVIHTENSQFFFMRIQDFLRDVFPGLGLSVKDVFAVCSYVPDAEAQRMIVEKFPQCRVFYPNEIDVARMPEYIIDRGGCFMDERFEELKRALFMGGLEAIEDFLGYEIDDEDKDVIENRLDMAFDTRSDAEMEEFYKKHGIKSEEAFTVQRLIKALQDDGITLVQVSEELSYRERAGVRDGHAGWDDNLIDYPTAELERIEAAWSEMEKTKNKVRVAIESTDDYAEPGFGARLVDDDVRNEDGTYGRVVESYRIVHINENGRIEKLDDRVFDSADDAKEAALTDSSLELVGYDDLVYEAGRSLGAVLAAAEAKASVVGTRDLGPGARGGMCK